MANPHLFSMIPTVVLTSIFIACSQDVNRTCDAIPQQEFDVPSKLSETGLYADIGQGEFSPAVSEFSPAYALWTDGAKKRRWVYIPVGQTIDSANMDYWSYPVGTKFWKEFVVDGKLVETRYMHKVGNNDDEWEFAAYVWNNDKTEALASLLGEIDVDNTLHDVPQAADCVACHRPETGSVLGFSAIQLSSPPVTGLVNIDSLINRNLLSQNPANPITIPGKTNEQNALGYLHANCSHCHSGLQAEVSSSACFNPESQLNFRLDLDTLSTVENTNVIQTALDRLISPNNPANSELINRISSRGDNFAMPPLGTEVVDQDAIKILTDWLEGL